MDRLRPRQPYQTLSSTETIPHYDQGAEIELQPRFKSASFKSSSSSYEPLNGSASKSSGIFTHERFSGWRVGTASAALVVILSLICNIAVAAWLSRNATFQDGLAELTRGDCARIEQTDTLVHLAINILSTLMLSGSNYAMQVLVGPSRQEVDNAHRKGKWLDIGIPSLRNLTSISRVRACLWGVLCLSSLPLHLMFNSAFYSALSTNDYNVFLVTDSFPSGANFTTNAADSASLESLRQTGNLENLTNADCIRAYAQDIITDRRNLIIVSTNASSNALLHTTPYKFSSAIILSIQKYEPYDWICDPATIAYGQQAEQKGQYASIDCHSYVSYTIAHASEWAPYGAPAEYCLSEKVPEQCSFNANLPIIITVIACNVIKAVVLIYVALSHRSSPLLVIGDALASFLTAPDETTKQICLLTRSEVNTSYILEQRWPVEIRLQQGYPPLLLKTAVSKQETWASAPSSRRWTATILILGGCIIVTGGLLVAAITNIRGLSAASIVDLGFGKVSAQSLISGDGWAPNRIKSASGQVLASILIANIPQLILSLLYFNINGLLTVMLMASEWSRFAVQRKNLRVSSPRGDQRSTYFLQLPYRVAIPLLVLSTLLHWLISQSIFLAVISEWDASGSLVTATQVASCGFSPLPIILTLSLGVVAFVALILTRFKKYNPFIPLVGSCSAAIAAACHVPDRDEDIALKPVKWGAVKLSGLTSGGPGEVWPVGHCCFSSEEVATPEDGALYAGLPPNQI